MITLALRNVGCVYDKDDKCVGKFLVNSTGFNIGGSMPRYFCVIDGADGNRLWYSGDDLHEANPNSNSAENLPDKIYILMDIVDATNVPMSSIGITWDDDPKVIGNLSYYYSKVSEGVYALC